MLTSFFVAGTQPDSISKVRSLFKKDAVGICRRIAGQPRRLSDFFQCVVPQLVAGQAVCGQHDDGRIHFISTVPARVEVAEIARRIREIVFSRQAVELRQRREVNGYACVVRIGFQQLDAFDGRAAESFVDMCNSIGDHLSVLLRSPENGQPRTFCPAAAQLAIATVFRAKKDGLSPG